MVEAGLDVVVDGTSVGWARDLERPDGAALLQLRLRRTEPGDIVVLSSFDALSSVSRKTPLGLVRAFREAFPGRPYGAPDHPEVPRYRGRERWLHRPGLGRGAPFG